MTVDVDVADVRHLDGDVYESEIVWPQDDFAVRVRVRVLEVDWHEGGDLIVHGLYWEPVSAVTLDEIGGAVDSWKLTPDRKYLLRGLDIERRLIREIEEEAKAAIEDDAADYGEAKARWG